jgi:hypothetical protein
MDYKYQICYYYNKLRLNVQRFDILSYASSLSSNEQNLTCIYLSFYGGTIIEIKKIFWKNSVDYNFISIAANHIDHNWI